MTSDSQAITVHSYAKVNLTLDVLGKRPDGFHAIESVMQTISLHDTVTLRVGDEPGIRVACDMPGIPTGEENLAYKAASLFFEGQGIAPSVDIRIEKRIPPKAGLGGGSSNAAAVLRALSRMLKREGEAPAEPHEWKETARESAFAKASADRTPTGELMELAAKVGSDVPFFLVGGTAFVCGRGEEVQPLPDIPTWWLVIVKPPFGISTAWAYARLDEIRPVASERESHSDRILRYIEAASPHPDLLPRGEGDGLQSAVCSLRSLPDLLSNNLELAAIERHPGIGEIKEALLRVGAHGALMCGSGSAVFGLFDSEVEAHRAADMLDTKYGESFLVRTITRGEALELD
ncbi:MAG TPA: 4-(cytidine 5'-diphospho)-2-C-methyl-D-erythritol kinase [Armatimonadota bacterium]|nr:4-(cytidine 5'-diphospho)-2-C-methyl-D-erythritol kinase [Armatimonadota bacterium]